jgi:acetylornithine deacetylase
MSAVTARIAELVKMPSVSSVRPEFDMPNRAVVDRLAEWLEHEGFAIEIMPVTPDGKKANLVATKGRGPGGLVLSGHTDTVPFDAGKWSSDPFRATERDGKLYGLGTSDMKAFFALAIEASRRAEAASLREPLIVLATCDEECGMAGARALARADRPKARAAIIGEPTNLRPVRLHKGVTMARLTLTGRSGHSSDPSLGASALEGMRVALNELVTLRDEIGARHRNDALRPPVPTMNLGNVHGGDNPNRICAECALEFDLRVLPGMRESDVLVVLRARIEHALSGSGLSIDLHELHEAVPPFETPPAAAIVRTVEQLTGHAAEAVSFGTEGPFLNALGMETIVLGPGDIACAHQPDEHLALDRIEPTITLLERAIGELCVEAGRARDRIA